MREVIVLATVIVLVSSAQSDLFKQRKQFHGEFSNDKTFLQYSLRHFYGLTCCYSEIFLTHCDPDYSVHIIKASNFLGVI